MDIRPLKPELQEKAIRELNEDPIRIPDAFDHIRDWLRKQPHLNVRKDDQMMIAFLRGCKWNLQIAKQKLDYFYSAKSQISDFFVDRDPLSPKIQKVLKAGRIFPLPNLENEFGPAIIFCHMKGMDVNETPLVEVLKVLFMTIDILLREDDNLVVSGLTMLIDYDECPASYYLQFTPTLIMNYLKCLQNAYPLRIKNAVVFNTVSVLQVIYNTVFKPFMSTKLYERVQVLNEPQTKKFFSDLPKNPLPKELGGTNESIHIAAENWKKKVESYREWFIEDAKYVSDEKLRIANTSMFENDIGVDGTFRKLVID
ncbi:hypothetical protein RI129_009529 [Pyrocoelia pectoralis]|uniref:CRAL-TRIO domain-containing protein n=1 Tax=Pyrocoelia pectoralis TaxID=417401 RepID=A0AAN7ZEZ5_9COLE